MLAALKVLVLAVFIFSCDASRHIFLHKEIISTLESEPTQHKNALEAQNYQYLVHVSNVFSNEDRLKINAKISPFYLGTYIPQNTYLLVAPKKIAKKVESLSDLVLWVGAFLPQHKISTSTETLLRDPPTSQLIVSLPPEPSDAPRKRTLQDAQAIAAKWQRSFFLTGIKITCTAVSATKIVVDVNPKLNMQNVAVWVSNQPESHWIEVATPQRFHNQFASAAIYSNGIGSGFATASQAGLTGFNQTVAIADTGIDTTSCYFPSGKVTIKQAGDSSDSDGHGTFISGTVAGNAAGPDGIWNGMAPSATINFYDITTGSQPFTNTAGFRTQVLDNEKGNIILFTFGSNVSSYTSFAHDIDAFINDNANTPSIVIVPSGNEIEPSRGGLIEAAYAKNALVVGASQTLSKGLLSENLTNPNTGPLNAPVQGSSVLASFSAHGPTYDGRIKPDVVAPGQRLTSAAKGSCGQETREGTSYAAAVAAGAAALVRDWFSKQTTGSIGTYYKYPPGHLVKAMLIHSGQSLLTGDVTGKGNYIALHEAWPSGYQGFGRIQLDQLFATTNLTVFTDGDAGAPFNTGSFFRTCAKVYPGAKYLKFTITWPDPPASPASLVSLVNDLDIVVTNTNGNIWKTSTAGGEYDQLNNVEQIYIPNPAPGMYSLSVYGARVPVGGQRWSAVVSGDADFTSPQSYCTPNFDTDTSPVCPNACSTHGTCTSSSVGSGQFFSQCNCNPGFGGVDCSKDTCPGQCSNKGQCDFVTGVCNCFNAADDPLTGCATLIVDRPLPQASTVTIDERAPNQLAYYVGIAVAGFLFGAFVLGIIGFFCAVRHLEKKRARTANKDDGNKNEEEMK